MNPSKKIGVSPKEQALNLEEGHGVLHRELWEHKCLRRSCLQETMQTVLI